MALLLLAWALPSVVTAKMFEWLYHPAGGLVNFLLGGRPVNWLGDPALALPSLIAADVWRTTPFVALLCYARLLTIPAELYEAAEVDGAAGVQAFARERRAARRRTHQEPLAARIGERPDQVAPLPGMRPEPVLVPRRRGPCPRRATEGTPPAPREETEEEVRRPHGRQLWPG